MNKNIINVRSWNWLYHILIDEFLLNLEIFVNTAFKEILI